MRNPGMRPLCFALLAFALSCGDDGSPANPGGGSTGVSFDNFQDAAVVIGQIDKTSGSANAGGSPNAVGLDGPFGTGMGALYVPDMENNRVLGFSGIPTADGAAASFVLGQPDLTSSAPGVTAQSFDLPVDCAVSGGKLLVADYDNNRVLIWNSLPSSNVPADVVVGQSDFTVSSSATTQTGLYSPSRVAVAGGKMFVSDFLNHRVLIWNTVPTTNGAPASVVVGQNDFTTATTGLTASTFGFPLAMWTDGTRLVIGDSSNDRVLIWNTIPTTNGAAADVVVGAADFVTAGSNTASGTSIGRPAGLWSDAISLYVADRAFNRVLIFSPFPTTNGASAMRVLGQAGFTNSTANDANQDGVADATPTARTLWGPTHARVSGSHLLVADQGNNRILIFNSR